MLSSLLVVGYEVCLVFLRGSLALVIHLSRKAVQRVVGGFCIFDLAVYTC